MMKNGNANAIGTWKWCVCYEIVCCLNISTGLPKTAMDSQYSFTRENTGSLHSKSETGLAQVLAANGMDPEADVEHQPGQRQQYVI